MGRGPCRAIAVFSSVPLLASWTATPAPSIQNRTFGATPVVGWAHADPQDASHVLAWYRDVILVYRARGLEAAKLEIANLNSTQIRGAVNLLHRRGGDPIASYASTGIVGWDSNLLGAAMVLHIDLFVDGAKHGRVVPWQLDCAVQLLETYRGAEADQRLRRSSTLAIAWLLQITGRFEMLRSHLHNALNEYPDDAELLVAQAVLEESSASPRLGGSLDDRGVMKGLKEAEVKYRRALTVAPALTEARARLGYVLLRLNRLDEARHELATALSTASASRAIYLAALFLGAVHEAAGNIDLAVATYRRARDVAPGCQVAAIGLANALRLTGQYEGAAEAARTAAMAGAAACDDPWWSYGYGQAWQLDETIERLRRIVRE